MTVTTTQVLFFGGDPGFKMDEVVPVERVGPWATYEFTPRPVTVIGAVHCSLTKRWW